MKGDTGGSPIRQNSPNTGFANNTSNSGNLGWQMPQMPKYNPGMTGDQLQMQPMPMQPMPNNPGFLPINTGMSGNYIDWIRNEGNLGQTSNSPNINQPQANPMPGMNQKMRFPQIWT